MRLIRQKEHHWCDLNTQNTIIQQPLHTTAGGPKGAARLLTALPSRRSGGTRCFLSAKEMACCSWPHWWAVELLSRFPSSTKDICPFHAPRWDVWWRPRNETNCRSAWFAQSPPGHQAVFSVDETHNFEECWVAICVTRWESQPMQKTSRHTRHAALFYCRQKKTSLNYKIYTLSSALNSVNKSICL